MEIDLELLLQTFSAEADEQIAAMEEALLALELRPRDPEILARLFRAAHSLKGNATMVGFNAIAERAHIIEDVLDALRKQALAVSRELITLLLAAGDVLRAAVAAAHSDEEAWTDEQSRVFEKLAPFVRTAYTSQATDHTNKGTPPALLKRETSEAQKPFGGAADFQRRTLRIDAAKLDRMLNLSGEISLVRGRLRTHIEAGSKAQNELLQAFQEEGRLHLALQEEIMKARMVPVGPLFRQYHRTVRDLALSCGKQVELLIEGEDVELDTTVSEYVRDPLLHMIRNALDHGIETAAVRAAHGKNPVGKITLSARREAGNILIALTDDGAGFNKARILKRAVAQGYAGAAELKDADLFRLVLESGFSTAETGSDLSGRGVGMDVVRRNIESLRGSIAISSAEGVGSTITLRFPLTLAIIQGFFVEVAGETYVIPLDAVNTCLELPPEQVRHSDGCGVFNLGGVAMPYLRLRELFALSGRAPPRENVVVVKHGERQAGIAVDDLLGDNQAVIKPLGRLFRDIPAIAGSTLAGDGRVALILDIPAVLRLIDARAAGRTSSQSEVS